MRTQVKYNVSYINTSTNEEREDVISFDKGVIDKEMKAPFISYIPKRDDEVIKSITML